MAEAVETLDGWYAWHDLVRVDWERWWKLNPAERLGVLEEWLELQSTWEELERTRQGSFGLYAMAGSRADLMTIHLRPTLDELVDVKAAVQRTRLHGFLLPAYGYISVVELATYTAKGNPDPLSNPELRERLWPTLPKRRAVVFYPMSKRRQGDDNWYMLERHARAALMKGHGGIGHKYSDRVTQIITGSQGLDDWEWGVSLFADDPLLFKKLVYEMRFAEVSARVAEFGPFYVGIRLDHDGFRRRMEGK